MAQSHGATIWRERANSGATPTITECRFVLVSPGIYEIDTAGALAASLVSDGVGGYDLSDTNLTGIGRIVVVGATATTGELY